MLCIGLVVAFVLFLLVEVWWWGPKPDEPAWSRRLGEWWKRRFPSREEREQRIRGFEVQPKESDAPEDDTPANSQAGQWGAGDGRGPSPDG